jgi:hypothetical protein
MPNCRRPFLLAMAAWTATGVAACHDVSRPDPPLQERHGIVVLPADTVVEFGGRWEVLAYDSGFVLQRRVVNPIVRSLDTSIVRVTANAVFLAVGSGTTRLEFRRPADTMDVVRATITVRPIRVIVPESATVQLGRGSNFYVRYTGPDAEQGLDVRSSDTTIASINGDVRENYVEVRGRKLGTAAITVTPRRDSARAATFTVTVIPRSTVPQAITVALSPIELRGPKGRTVFYAAVRADNGDILDVDPTIVSTGGLLSVVSMTRQYDNARAIEVTAAKPGVGELVMTAGGAKGSVPVRVHAAAGDTLYAFTGRASDLLVGQNDFAASAALAGFALQPLHGSVAIGTGGARIVYSAAVGYVGRDSFDYVVRDPATDSRDTARVRVNVVPGPYSPTILSVPGATVSAADLNNSGVVAGTARFSATDTRAFRWRNGQVEFLPNQFGGVASANAINDRGDVAGLIGSRAVLWRAGDTLATILAADDTSGIPPRDINNKTQVLLGSPFGTSVARIWTEGVVRALPLPCSSDAIRLGLSVPVAIDDAGEVAIAACFGFIGHTAAAVITSSGASRGICFVSVAAGMNKQGWVFGVTRDLQGIRTILYVVPLSGECIEIVASYDPRLAALTAINDAGTMFLGDLRLDTSRPADLTPALLIGKAAAPLDQLMTTAAGAWRFTRGIAIDNTGRILAVAVDPVTGAEVPVLLTPP